MDAIAVCDHQVVQAFPMAQHKVSALNKKDPERKFKMLYGCEMSMVDPVYHIVYNNDHRKLEDAEYVGNYYGTSLKVIREKLDQGVDVLLDIEVQGAAKVRERCPEAVLIFLIPPSLEELARRLHRRNTDEEGAIQRRLEKARQECRECVRYDYLVVNDTVMNAALEIGSILQAEQCRAGKRLHLAQSIIGQD